MLARLFLFVVLSLLISFNVYLFSTVSGATRADIVYQTQLIPARIDKAVEIIGIAIQERGGRTAEAQNGGD